MLTPLQAAGLVPELDSLAVREQGFADLLRSSSPEELWSTFLDHAINFGVKVLLALLLYFVGGWLIRMIIKLVKKGNLKRKTEPTLATFVESLVSIALWIVLICITVSILGVNSASVAALLASGGVAIGLALSGTMQNFAGGLMLLIFKPFKVGDFIEAQGFSGFVTELNIVSTKLLTTDNRQVILPNGTLSNGNLVNVNRMPLRRIDIPVSVAYGSDAKAVEKALLEIARQNEQVLDSTTAGAADPAVLLMDLGDSSVNFVFRSWVNSADYWPVRAWLCENVYMQLPAKYGIQFPFPQMDVHIRQ